MGDRVILSCVRSCGRWSYCRKGLYSHCLAEEGMAGIGRIFGYTTDGTQAEDVRVPIAENSVYPLPPGMTDAEGILLSDIPPTGFEIIAVDLDDARLRRAKEFGATATVNSGDPDRKEQVLALADGLGVDVAIEAVGIPETFTTATVIVRPGGDVADIGVHGKSVDLALDEPWIRNIDISMGPVDTNTLGMLLSLVAELQLPADTFVTHEFSFDRMLEAYDVFGHAADHDAPEVLIHQRRPARARGDGSRRPDTGVRSGHRGVRPEAERPYYPVPVAPDPR